MSLYFPGELTDSIWFADFDSARDWAGEHVHGFPAWLVEPHPYRPCCYGVRSRPGGPWLSRNGQPSIENPEEQT